MKKHNFKIKEISKVNFDHNIVKRPEMNFQQFGFSIEEWNCYLKLNATDKPNLSLELALDLNLILKLLKLKSNVLHKFEVFLSDHFVLQTLYFKIDKSQDVISIFYQDEKYGLTYYDCQDMAKEDLEHLCISEQIFEQLKKEAKLGNPEYFIQLKGKYSDFINALSKFLDEYHQEIINSICTSYIQEDKDTQCISQYVKNEIDFVKKLNTEFNQIYWSKDCSKRFGLEDFSHYINQFLKLEKTFNKLIYINVNGPSYFPQKIKNALNKHKLPVYNVKSNYVDFLFLAETFQQFEYLTQIDFLNDKDFTSRKLEDKENMLRIYYYLFLLNSGFYLLMKEESKL